MAKQFLMPDDELAVRFRQAKNKPEQVNILADLNLCAPFDIAERLEELGEFEGTGLKASSFSNHYSPIPARPAKRGRPPSPPGTKPAPVTPFNENRARELWAQGLDDIAMADALGLTVHRVGKWRRKHGLMRPRGGTHTTKQEEPEMETLEVMDPGTDKTTVITSESAAPEEAARVLSAAEFLKTVTELLTPAAVRAGLYLNGAPVRQVSAIHIKMRGDSPCVDIVTEEAEA